VWQYSEQMLQSFVLLTAMAAALAQAPARPDDIERLQDGIRVRTAGGVLSLHVRAESILRVTFAPG